MRMSLQNRLLFPVLGLIALGMGTAAFVTDVLSSNALRKAMIGQTKIIADNSVRELSFWLDDVEKYIVSQAELDSVRAAVGAAAGGHDSASAMNAVLKDAGKRYEYYESLSIIDRRGETIATSNDSAPGSVNVSDKAYYRESMQGKVAVSDVQKSGASGKPVFFVSAPVLEGGNIIGVVAGSVDFSYFSKLFANNVKIGDTGYVYVVNRDGLVISHPDRSLVLNLNIRELDFGRGMLEMHDGETAYTFKGVAKHVTFRTLNKTKWMIGVTTDDKDIFSPVTAIRNRNILTTLAILALSAVLIYFLCRNISKIIRSVSTEFQNMAQACIDGQLSLRGDPMKIDFEFRSIVEGANRMLDALMTPLNIAVQYVDRIGHGDIPPRITEDFKGEFNAVKDNLNACIDNVNALSSETEMLIGSALAGKLTARADASGHQGDYRKIVEGINKMMDALVGHIDNVPLPIVLMDKDLDIQFMNKTGSTLLGTPMPQLLNTKCYNHFKTSDCRTDKCACAKALEQGMRTAGETDAHPAGLDLQIQYIGNPIKDDNGSVVGVMEVVVDMTAIRKAQQLADKQAAYERREVEKLVVNLEKLASGNTNVEISPAPPDEDTRAIADSFASVYASLNECAGAVTHLISDMDLLAQAAVEGRLDVRSEASRHRGDYCKIVAGVNRTLDTMLTPVKDAASCLEAIAGGDMRVSMSGEYRGDHSIIKNALNGTLGSINEILNPIRQATQQVYAGAHQVSDSSQSLSQGATEQAASIEQITSSMTELAAQTRGNAENAAQANLLAVNARESAEKGSRQMTEMGAAMKEINEASQSIAKIIKVIDDIAFQTNLLALNAAVEAARAGRHGKGFAVVAEEVRNLAGRSAKAAKETTEMIESSMKKVEKGSEIAGRSTEALNEIVRTATKTTDLVGEIAAASNEQAQGIAQINEGLNQIDSVTQQNTANAEETAAASQELVSQAKTLNRILSRFKLRNGGDGAQEAPALPSPDNTSFHQPTRPMPTEWGGHPGSGRTGTPRTLTPEDVISLDDAEFAKY